MDNTLEGYRRYISDLAEEITLKAFKEYSDGCRRRSEVSARVLEQVNISSWITHGNNAARVLIYSENIEALFEEGIPSPFEYCGSMSRVLSRGAFHAMSADVNNLVNPYVDEHFDGDWSAEV